jgi:succinate dehydrogenase/fumarate reductase flavoprotein subunit
VLVIGGGIGGCRAAIRAAELGAKVILSDKARIGRAGPMTFVHSQFAAWRLNEEERKAWKHEFVASANYLADQDWIDALLAEIPDRIDDLISWGVEYERDKNGHLKYTPSRGQRVGRTLNVDGRVVMEKMRLAAKRAGVQLLEKVAFTDLLTSDGCLPTKAEVCGAHGVHMRTGRNIVVSAKAVVLNTGPLYPKVHAAHVDGVTGEGHRMAYLAGAKLTGMEFTQYAIWSFFNDRFLSPGQAKIQGIGAKFINAKGEAFMSRYDPEWGDMSSLFRIARGIAQENLEGRGPCYCDMTHCKPEDIEMLLRVVPTLGKACKDFGWDLTKNPLKVAPMMAIGMGTSGGIDVDVQSRTNVPGLYAVGTCTSLPICISGNTGSGHSSFSNVGGYRAGTHAAMRAKRVTLAPVHEGQLRNGQEQLDAPTRRFKALRPRDLWNWIGDTTTESTFALFKDAAKIKEVLGRLREIRGFIDRAHAPDPHELVKWIEARSYVEMVEVCCHAYLAREESRGEHIRVDHPYQDDENWLKWVMLQCKDVTSEPEVTLRELPWDRWEVQPPKRERIPYSFGKPPAA